MTQSVLLSITSIAFIIVILCQSPSHGSESSLRLVQIVQRHGDRNPTNFYPNDPHKDEDNWPEGIGETTMRGKTRMFEFGVTMRKRYDSYLGDSPRDVSCRSSALTRTLESAQCFLAGLYEPKGFWIWNNDSHLESSAVAKHWQPIAVNTVLAADDGLLRTTSNCPKADQLWREFMQNKEVTDYLNQNQDFIKYLSTKTGDEYWTVRPSPLRPLEFLSTTLRVERENGLDMPEWADATTLDKLRDLELHAFYFDWNSRDIQRLRAGLLLQELAGNMLTRADQIMNKSNKTTKKLYVYETHDVNQVVLMQALNVYDSPQVNRTPPTYTASLVFELHQIEDQFVVKLLYFNNISEANTATNAFVELQLKNCDPKSDCTLKKFIESIGDLIPNDWHIECDRISAQSYTFFNPFSIVYIVIGLLCGIIITSLFACFCRSRRTPNLPTSDETNTLKIHLAKKYSD